MVSYRRLANPIPKDHVPMPYPTGAGVVCVGIDLAGVPRRETGVAVLREGRLDLLTTAGSDDEILALAALAGPDGTIAINAPTTRPRGRCCLDDDCTCRYDPGTRSREIERELLRMGVPILATTLIKVLARRGIRLAAEMRRIGWVPLEVYPYATLRLLGLPTAGKRTLLGRRRIHQALQAWVAGLDHPDASEHQLDAVACALTAHLSRSGQTRTVGAPDEGLMTIPDPDLVRAPARPSPDEIRRVAEGSSSYDPDQRSGR
jgi:predicted nuclease with RNAse H fold